MASKEHFDSCDFTDAVTLAAPGEAGTSQSYTYICDTPGEVAYLACSVAEHCAMGQKIEVVTSSSVRVHDPATGETLVHMSSLARMNALLSHPAMDTGFQTEAQANATLELIWCLEAHCPDSARDVNPEATEASCLADVYNLGGYVSRSRPQPLYALALEYYETALAHDPLHCDTLEYRTELYLQMADAASAAESALALCTACPARDDLHDMARAAFDATSALAAEFPQDACALAIAPAPPPPLPPPAGSMMGDVNTRDDVVADEDGGGTNVAVVAGAVVGGTAALLLTGALYCRLGRSRGRAAAAPAVEAKRMPAQKADSGPVRGVERTPTAGAAMMA